MPKRVFPTLGTIESTGARSGSSNEGKVSILGTGVHANAACQESASSCVRRKRRISLRAKKRPTMNRLIGLDATSSGPRSHTSETKRYDGLMRRSNGHVKAKTRRLPSRNKRFTGSWPRRLRARASIAQTVLYASDPRRVANLSTAEYPAISLSIRSNWGSPPESSNRY